jgi:hypothetical protein
MRRECVFGQVAPGSADGYLDSGPNPIGACCYLLSERSLEVVGARSVPGQLQANTPIFALGDAGPDGTLSARAVAAVSQFPPGTDVGISVKNCSHSSLVEALGALSGAPTSVR